LEHQLKRAQADLITYEVRAKGFCPYCEDVVMDSAIKCESCGEQFWMNQAEAEKSKDACLSRIEKINMMLRTIG
jgi:formylmethanofuran dehydrogenase subunit E